MNEQKREERKEQVERLKVKCSETQFLNIKNVKKRKIVMEE